MRRPPDPAPFEARELVATSQLALDRAHQRVRELEGTSATMAERLAAQTERADHAEFMLIALRGTGASRRRAIGRAHAEIA